jgi:hypothetical protein
MVQLLINIVQGEKFGLSAGKVSPIGEEHQVSLNMSILHHSVIQSHRGLSVSWTLGRGVTLLLAWL